YPQAAFPYAQLVDENRRRGKGDTEFELMDTGVFDDERYFDVQVEYAKATPEDLLVRITVFNRGTQSARLRVLPTIWFRNTWSWAPNMPRPSLKAADEDGATIELREPDYGVRWLSCDGSPELLFTENETNFNRVFGYDNGARHVKDSINDYVVHGDRDAV